MNPLTLASSPVTAGHQSIIARRRGKEKPPLKRPSTAAVDPEHPENRAGVIRGGRLRAWSVSVGVAGLA